jgi:hypothetical protein
MITISTKYNKSLLITLSYKLIISLFIEIPETLRIGYRYITECLITL